MPTFTSPLRTDWSYVEGASAPSHRQFWGHFGTQPRGSTVIRTSGTWATVSFPTHTQLEAADTIAFPDGTSGKAVLLGGHETPVTAAIATELTNAGYGAYLT